MERARAFAGWLINQNVAGHLSPSDASVVTDHSINTEEQREIDVPPLMEEVCCVTHK